ncbi:hypothetical protein C2S51_006616 [Perilla frutescens var. frutescens]|nr:hypothetical protein C2S51_006616 [Perilla frutescens var. frutescens]
MLTVNGCLASQIFTTTSSPFCLAATARLDSSGSTPLSLIRNEPVYPLLLSKCRGFAQSEFAASAAALSSVQRSVICSSFWGGGLDLRYVEARARRRRRLLAKRAASTFPVPCSEMKMNLNEYMVTLEKPLGIRFALSVDGKVFVHALQKGDFEFVVFINLRKCLIQGNAEKSRIIMVGDTLKKASGSSGEKLVEIKDFGDTESFTKEKSGVCSLVLERPFAPFPIHQLYLMDDIDILFNRGRVPIATWSKSLRASNSQDSSESSGNSGFAVFCPKFLTSKGWKCLNDQSKNGYSRVGRNAPALPFSPLVAIFTEEVSENVEWGHGSFPLDEYIKALDRSKGELYYNHSLGMRYSKVCF